MVPQVPVGGPPLGQAVPIWARSARPSPWLAQADPQSHGYAPPFRPVQAAAANIPTAAGLTAAAAGFNMATAAPGVVASLPPKPNLALPDAPAQRSPPHQAAAGAMTGSLLHNLVGDFTRPNERQQLDRILLTMEVGLSIPIPRLRAQRPLTEC